MKKRDKTNKEIWLYISRFVIFTDTVVLTTAGGGGDLVIL
jgi:hypothetical protein